MAIGPNNLRNSVTGDPVRVNVNPKVDRKASKKGIRQSGVESMSEFNQIIQSELKLSARDIGSRAVDINRGGAIDLRA